MIVRRFVQRHQLATFLALACLLSWWPWPLTLLNEGSVAMIPWGPAVAAIAVSLIAVGGAGVLDLFRRLAQWNVAPQWYAAALGIPLVAWALSAGMTKAVLGGTVVTALTWEDLLMFPLSILSIGLVKGPLTEELGWRGFALPRLLVLLPPIPASFTIGLIWFAWHLPLLLTDSTRPMLPFAISILAFSLILTWLHLGTGGSLLIAVLFHASVNTMAAHVVLAFAPEDRLTVWWTFAVLISLVALGVVRSKSLRVRAREARAKEHLAVPI